MNKICIKCNESLPVSDFYKQSGNREDYHPQCKKCRKEYNKRYDHKKKLYARRANKKRLGLTLDQFEELLKKQKGLCAICGLPSVDTNQHGPKDLAIDHNHNTGKVRGLLCSKCNRAIGLLNVDNLGILNLQKAIKYLI